MDIFGETQNSLHQRKISSHNDSSNFSWVFSVAAATMLVETNLLGKYAKEKSREEDEPKWKSCNKWALADYPESYESKKEKMNAEKD